MTKLTSVLEPADLATITGEITFCQPVAIPPGYALDLYISFSAFNPAWVTWETRLVVHSGSMRAIWTQTHWSDSVQRENIKMSLGVMPTNDIEGIITLQYRNTLGMMGYHTLDEKSFHIFPSTKPELIQPLPLVPEIEPAITSRPEPEPEPTKDNTYPYPEPPTPKEKETWMWVAVGGVAILVIALLLGGK